jgi:CBS domain-containing protein
MNILFFLKPKTDVVFINEGDTVRQALEKMEHYRHASIPILKEDGSYLGTLSEGDLLWFLKDNHNMSLLQTEEIPITKVPRYFDDKTVRVETDVEALFQLSAQQNFVPVVDDRGMFIGIVTRKDIINHMIKIRK